MVRFKTIVSDLSWSMPQYAQMIMLWRRIALIAIVAALLVGFVGGIAIGRGRSQASSASTGLSTQIVTTEELVAWARSPRIADNEMMVARFATLANAQSPAGVCKAISIVHTAPHDAPDPIAVVAARAYLRTIATEAATAEINAHASDFGASAEELARRLQEITNP